jgi:hypothetical protein
MMRRTRAKAVARTAQPLRLLALFAAGVFFLIAQALVGAHASGGVDDLEGHSAAECAVCIAGGALDDPESSLPALTRPGCRADAAKTAIPAALLTEIAVRAASPRAPPLT